MENAMDKVWPGVLQVMPGEDFTVYVYFSDGTVRLFDVKPYIEQGGVFAQLKDLEFFVDRLAVMNGTVAWDLSGHFDPCNCIDLDPLTVYEKSPVVADPLKEQSA